MFLLRRIYNFLLFEDPDRKIASPAELTQNTVQEMTTFEDPDGKVDSSAELTQNTVQDVTTFEYPDWIVASPGEFIQATVQDVTTFAFDLFRHIPDTDRNMCISPFGIASALAMAFAGARGNTANQMAEVLCFSLPQPQLYPALGDLREDLDQTRNNPNAGFLLANSLWVQKEYNIFADYLKLLEKFFRVRAMSVDFSAPEMACRIINGWVSEATGGKINGLMSADDVSGSTRLVLITTTLFKGVWDTPFKPDQTRQEPFWVTPQTTVPVQMMNQTTDFNYAETPDLQILEMPYKGDALSMLVLLPRQRDGVADLQNALSAQTVTPWMEDLKMCRVFVKLPKFKLSNRVDLSESLKLMGMVDAFSETQADFTGIAPRIHTPLGTANLCVSQILNDAHFQVDEKVTEIVTATRIDMTMAITALPNMTPRPDPIVFWADHPFIFLIRERITNNILYVGRITNPNPGASPQPPGADGARLGTDAPGNLRPRFGRQILKPRNE